MSDTSWIAVLIAGISAAGVTGSFFLSWWAQKKDNDRKYTELIIQISDDLIDLEEKKAKLTTKAEILSWLFTHLNKLEQIAYLTENGKISNEAIEFFKVHIPFAYYGLEKLDYEITQKTFGPYQRKIRKKSWPHLMKWCMDNPRVISELELQHEPEWLTRLLATNKNDSLTNGIM